MIRLHSLCIFVFNFINPFRDSGFLVKPVHDFPVSLLAAVTNGLIYGNVIWLPVASLVPMASKWNCQCSRILACSLTTLLLALLANRAIKSRTESKNNLKDGRFFSRK